MSDQDEVQAALDSTAEELGPVDPFAWLKAHRWPAGKASGPRPVLTPEEFGEAPLSEGDRVRRARLLARVREANHPRLR
ncbi:hypothetical protein PUR61_20110 [Streptomyces sp. BE20]|uniref:hypothetical protein n=1 Tax=unclassified Streptomyces TaxID=2593676 RepID=UPI002E7764DE|nr:MULTISPECIES: hypothetical protein [unclassified Streptomyces]MED7949485.1 hypothetical protein [Streptomyces sp. BE303]MEE1824462.1 hypothetical protein [Streptomyces sp. BE20]